VPILRVLPIRSNVPFALVIHVSQIGLAPIRI
jgi:hypothetical protein